MAFQLNGVVPWGRNLAEYRAMFRLTDADLAGRIAGFGDGPASFNCEATRLGACVVSFDPIYAFSADALRARIQETRQVDMEQMRANREKYVWMRIRDLDMLETIRMSAMETFLADYEAGKEENRYVPHALPDRLPCEDGAFELGLCSHFLFLYPSLGLSFHIDAITEMLRVCREVRVFPIVDLDANQTELAGDVMARFKKTHTVELTKTSYEFQKGGNLLLTIR